MTADEATDLSWVNAHGHRQERHFALGPKPAGWGAGAFCRPESNAAPFRKNDALARRVPSVNRQPTATDCAPVSTAVGKA